MSGQWRCACCAYVGCCGGACCCASGGRAVKMRLLLLSCCCCLADPCAPAHFPCPPLQIATWKSVVLGSLALGALGIAAANADGLAGLWGGYTDPASWAALGWAGLGPGALASYLHVTVRFAGCPCEAQRDASTVRRVLASCILASRGSGAARLAGPVCRVERQLHGGACESP